MMNELDTEIERILAMTDAEIKAEVTARGKNLVQEAADFKRKVMNKLREKAPYGEWCRDPLSCVGKGYCPKDPTCGD